MNLYEAAILVQATLIINKLNGIEDSNPMQIAIRRALQSMEFEQRMTESGYGVWNDKLGDT